MSKTMKMLRIFIISILAMAILTPMNAFAAKVKAPVCEKSKTVYFTHDTVDGTGDVFETASSFLFIKNMNKDVARADFVGVKSSNPKVAVVPYGNYAGENSRIIGLRILPKYRSDGSRYTFKNNEKATVTFTLRQNGKSYKLKCRVTLKRMNPLTTLKIGKANYAKQVKYYSAKALNAPASGGKVKLQIKANKRYKIEKILLVSEKWNGNRTVKNGSNVSLEDIEEIQVTLRAKTAPKYCPSSEKKDVTEEHVTIRLNAGN